MKKILVFVTPFIFAFASQTSKAQIGFQTGYVQSNFLQKWHGYETEDAEINGFTAGITYDFYLSTKLNIQTGINYSFLIEKDDFVTTKLQYLDIPVHVAYDFHIIDKLFISPYAGPRMAINISQSVNSPYEWTNSDFGPLEKNHFDLMLGAGVAINYDKFRIKTGYDWGLMNLATSGQSVKTFRNQFNVGVGYNF